MPVSFHGSVSSPVRSRIASLEAQAQASQKQGGYTSTAPNVSSSASAAAQTTTLADRQHAFFKQQKQQQHQSQVVHTNNNPTDASPGRDSVTTTASQNRINRIRQQQQQSLSPTTQRHTIATGNGGNSSNDNNNSHSQASHLMEKRKQHHQRRMVMKQQQQQQQDARSSFVGTSVPSADDSPAATTTTTPNRNSGTTPNNSNGTGGSGSGSRLSKMHRMQKRKGYDHVKSRQHLNSKLGGSVSAADAAAANKAATADTAAAAGTDIATTTGSSSTTRTHRQSSQNHTVQLPAVLSGASSSFSPRSPNAFSALGLDTSHENTATSREDGGTVATDEGDDATLTSVRRVMMGGGGGGGGDNHHQSHYEHLQSHLGGGHHASSGRPSTASTIVVNHSHDSMRRGGTGNGGGKNSGLSNDNLRGWINEEKSSKDHNSAFLSSSERGGGGVGGVDRLIRTASSSDYDTDGDVSKASRRSRQSATNLHRLLIDGGPSHSQVTDVNDFFTNPASKYGQSSGGKVDTNGDSNSITQPYGAGSAGFSSSNAHPYHHPNPHQPQGQARYNTDDDDRTFDYGDRDEGNDGGADADYDSDASGSYAKARRRRRQKQILEKQGYGSHQPGSASVLSKESPSKKGSRYGGDGETMNLLNAEDMEKYSKAMENPAVKLGAGVVGVATVGCVAFGPVGLLVGVAAVGLGFGVMQIPEEERNKIQEKAEKGFHTLQEKACDASETLSSNCLTTYKDSGVADHIPHCYSGTDVINKEFEAERAENFRNGNFEDPKIGGGAYEGANQPAVQDDPIATVKGGQTVPGQNSTGPSVPQLNERTRNKKKVACLRNVRILPASQIYSLDPAVQPRAWIDIVASANTTDAEKNEAMEEILLLAKDKRRAKIFLDEGILDSAVWSLSRYFEKLDPVGDQSIDWAHPEITVQEKTAANLAAQVCIVLGKAHCAAIHTEGDLMLMSQYEHGTVPEERQVAQMLHEVPHHVRVTKTSDPTIVIPSKEVFALRQLTLPQAEELARSIKAVAEGRM